MSQPAADHLLSLDDWLARDAARFDPDSPASADAAVDRIVAALGPDVDVLGFGEALHGGEELLQFRNKLFQRLVAVHGFSAIAVESSFPRGKAVDDYVAWRGPWSFDEVKDVGFSHGFGALEANRELVEWMRRHNADAGGAEPGRGVELRFYGFDSPTEMYGTDSPRQLLRVVLDFLAIVDGAGAGGDRRKRIEDLIGDNAAWENPAALMDPAKSIGLSPAAVALQAEAQNLINELYTRRRTLAEKAGYDRHLDAKQHALVAKQLLAYHAALATPSDTRIADLLGRRDEMMAGNLAHVLAREQGRGKVLAFAHNSHLKRGRAAWQWGPNRLEWRPAGSHLADRLGRRYAVIGSGLVESAENGIGPPEPGTIEARLAADGGPARFVPTRLGDGLAADALAGVPERSGSQRNPSYFPLTPQSVTDFDGWVVLDAATYTRGGRALG